MRPIAEVTTTGAKPFSTASQTRCIASRRSSAVARELPPNFCTTILTLSPRLDGAHLNSQFRYLHCIEGRAFTHLIRHRPEVESVFHREVAADPPYVYRILTREKQGHGIFLPLRGVPNLDTRRLLEQFPAFLR